MDVPGAGPIIAEIDPTADPMRHTLQLRDKSVERIAFQPSRTLLSPAAALPWLLGSLGVAACIAPWLARGWQWLDLIAATVILAACYDAFALWFARKEFVPVLLSSKTGLRGREGQSIQIPLALAGSGRRRSRCEVWLAIMAATRECETALSVNSGPQCVRLERSEPAGGRSGRASSALVHLWPWTPQVALLRRGLWPVPRVGIERRSRFGIWRLRQWFDSPALLRIDADLRPGRRGILRSPVYRALVASRQFPWIGHGREFERLREYQAGDNYAEIAWKSTARRGVPVTRLFQWEQKQEVYFVVDQSRVSALALRQSTNSESAASQEQPRRMLDLAVETALVGATVALELGDEFGLVTYADGAKSWLRAGSGQSQFHRFRDCLLNIKPLPTNADYEALFGDLRVRLRRRAYLLLLADLTERSISDSLRRGVGLVSSSHALLMTSILPAHARPAFSSREEDLKTDQDVYAALAGDRENQRLGALSRQLRQLDVQLRYISADKFLRTAVEGYMENKRRQRL